MSKPAVALANPAPAPELARLELVANKADDFAAGAKATSTVRAYTRDWRHFTSWCASHGPPHVQL